MIKKIQKSMVKNMENHIKKDQNQVLSQMDHINLQIKRTKKERKQ